MESNNLQNREMWVQVLLPVPNCTVWSNGMTLNFDFSNGGSIPPTVSKLKIFREIPKGELI